ncbi:MAG TPA: alpha/beta hydrolase, partial [Chloroflexota bacterium]
MGGRTLFQFALDHQDRLWGAVAVDAQSEAPQPAFAGELRLNRDLIARGDLEGFYRAAVPQGQVPLRLEREPDVRDWYRRHFFRNRPTGLLPLLDAILSMPRLTPRLHEIRVPFLAFVGSEDAHFLDLAERYRTTIPGARVVVVPGARHYPMFDQPERFNEALTRFLAEHAPDR